MKNVMILGALCLATLAGLFATDLDIQARGGYFYPLTGTPKKIYHGGGIYGGEVSTCLMDNIHVWGSVNYFTRRGKSGKFLSEEYSTRLTLLPVAAGIKATIPLECWLDAYVGIGAQYARFHSNDEAPFAIHHVKKWGWGGILKLGAVIHLNENLFLDLFSDYSLIKFKFRSKDGIVDRKRCALDGWIFGIGIGMHL